MMKDTSANKTTMELLLDSVCMLCDENTPVLSPHNLIPYVKFMKSTFFDKNKQVIEQFQQTTATNSICVMCTYKVITTYKFKDTYEDVVKKQTSFKKTRTACFLCKTKSADLVSTDDNPNGFNTKIKAFMNSTPYPSLYMQCVVCFDCIFCLGVWFETYSNLQKKFNIEVLANSEELSNTPKKALRKIQRANFKVSATKTDATEVTNKNKENLTPPENSEAGSNKRRSVNYAPVGVRSQKFAKLSTKRVLISEPESDSNATNTPHSSKSLPVFLKKKLKHLKTIKQDKNSAKWSIDVVNDKRMFQEIPYVLVARDAKVKKSKNTPTRRSRRLNAPLVTIELSDSDAETSKNVVANEKADIKGKDLLPQKTPIKIKLSSKFTYKPGPKSAKRGRATICKQAEYMCNICDGVFFRLCDYKQHSLWHEKPENPTVDIIRHQLPTHIKVSVFDSTHTSGLSSGKNYKIKIDEILSKYLGEKITETFEDTDYSNPKEIEDIIGHLNLPDSEEESQDTAAKKENKSMNAEELDPAIASDEAGRQSYNTEDSDKISIVNEVLEDILNKVAEVDVSSSSSKASENDEGADEMESSMEKLQQYESDSDRTSIGETADKNKNSKLDEDDLEQHESNSDLVSNGEIESQKTVKDSGECKVTQDDELDKDYLEQQESNSNPDGEIERQQAVEDSGECKVTQDDELDKDYLEQQESNSNPDSEIERQKAVEDSGECKVTQDDELDKDYLEQQESNSNPDSEIERQKAVEDSGECKVTQDDELDKDYLEQQESNSNPDSEIERQKAVEDSGECKVTQDDELDKDYLEQQESNSNPDSEIERQKAVEDSAGLKEDNDLNNSLTEDSDKNENAEYEKEVQTNTTIETDSSQNEQASDSDRTSIDEHDASADEIQKDVETSNDRNNTASGIEKLLAELHGERFSCDEYEKAEDKENEKGNNNGVTNGSNNENQTDDENVISGEDEDGEHTNNIHNKRKRISSNEDAENNLSEADKHSTKKVRFAMDYQGSDINPIFDEDLVLSHIDE